MHRVFKVLSASSLLVHRHQEQQGSQKANLNVTIDAGNHSPPQPNDQMRKNAMSCTCSTTIYAPEEVAPGINLGTEHVVSTICK